MEFSMGALSACGRVPVQEPDFQHESNDKYNKKASQKRHRRNGKRKHDADQEDQSEADSDEHCRDDNNHESVRTLECMPIRHEACRKVEDSEARAEHEAKPKIFRLHLARPCTPITILTVYRRASSFTCAARNAKLTRKTRG